MISFAACALALLSVLPGENDYLAGAEAQRAGKFAEAIPHFQAAAKKDPALRRFAAVREAQCRAYSGDRNTAVKALQALLKEDTTGAAALMAKGQLAKTLHSAGQHAAAVPMYADVTGVGYAPWWMDDWTRAAADNQLLDPKLASTGYAMLRQYVLTSQQIRPRLEAARRLGQSSNAQDRAAALLGMLRSSATTDAATIALTAPLSFRMDNGREISLASLAGHAVTAASEAQSPSLIEELLREQPDNLWVPAYLAWTVRSASKADNPALALEAGNMLVRHFPDSRDTGDALWTLAQQLSGTQPDTAIVLRQRIADSCPTHFRADDAIYENAQYFEAQKRPVDAVAAYADLAKRFPDSRFRSESLYRAAELCLGNNQKSQAQQYLQEAAQSGMGNFYGHRAMQRLASKEAHAIKVGGMNLLGITPGPKPKVAAAADLAPDALERLRFFASHGLEESEWETLHLLTQRENPTTTLLLLCAEAGLAHTALEFATSREGTTEKSATKSMDRLLLEFPRAYWPIMQGIASELQLDPYLLLAISKQESTFRPNLTSHAGASGVMQLMPATADWLAKVDPGIGPEHIANLESPVNSIRLGATYLRRMLDRSDGNLVYALASYNAGPGNCDKWRVARPNADPETFIEKIPFDETRDYCKKVLGNLAAYHSLYGKS